MSNIVFNTPDGSLALGCVTCSNLVETVDSSVTVDTLVRCSNCGKTFDYDRDILPYILRFCNLFPVNYIELDRRFGRSLPIPWTPHPDSFPVTAIRVNSEELGPGDKQITPDDVLSQEQRHRHPHGRAVALRMAFWSAVKFLADDARTTLIDMLNGTAARLLESLEREPDVLLNETMLEEIDNILFRLREKPSVAPDSIHDLPGVK